MTQKPAGRIDGLAPWVELSVVAAALLAVTWLMLWVAGTHAG